jgi:hypothetical protein
VYPRWLLYCFLNRERTLYLVASRTTYPLIRASAWLLLGLLRPQVCPLHSCFSRFLPRERILGIIAFVASCTGSGVSMLSLLLLLRPRAYLLRDCFGRFLHRERTLRVVASGTTWARNGLQTSSDLLTLRRIVVLTSLLMPAIPLITNRAIGSEARPAELMSAFRTCNISAHIHNKPTGNPQVI